MKKTVGEKRFSPLKSSFGLRFMEENNLNWENTQHSVVDPVVLSHKFSSVNNNNSKFPQSLSKFSFTLHQDVNSSDSLRLSTINPNNYSSGSSVHLNEGRTFRSSNFPSTNETQSEPQSNNSSFETLSTHSTSSMNSTFSEVFERLLSKQKRTPTITPPIKTIVNVHELIKKSYERQSESERYIKKERKIEESKVSTNPNKKQAVENTASFSTEDFNETIYVTMERQVQRNPSLSLPVRSVYIKKEKLLTEEMFIKTKRIGEYPIKKKKRFEESRAPLKPITNVANTQKKTITVPQETQKKKVIKENDESNKENNYQQPKKKEIVKSSSLFTDALKEKYQNIIKWYNSLGVSIIPSPSAANETVQQYEAELRNGLKLSEIICKLEGEDKLKGIDRRALTSGAVLNNLERCLSTFRENKGMKLTYLWAMKEIMNGDEEVIWGLLSDIHDAYKKKLIKVKKKKSNKEELFNQPVVTNKTNPKKKGLQERRETNEEVISLNDLYEMKRAILETMK